LAYLVTFLPVFVFTLFVILLANIVRSGLTVFFLSVIGFIAFHFFSILFPQFASFIVTSMFDWYTLWISEKVNVFKIVRHFLILFGCGIMLFTAGFYLFDRKEL
jgi:ABC-2 type transport system permease protein